MYVDVLLGLQWGDEGKGKVVDVLTPHYDVVARFQGGPNAGHTIKCNGQEYILRLVPSGILQGSMNIIGSGVVINPTLLWEEIKELEAKGVPWTTLTESLIISEKAHLILPTDCLLDAANEAAKGDKKIGTTGKGIGPAYADKINRIGLRMGNVLQNNFQSKYQEVKKKHLQTLQALNYTYDPLELEALEAQWFHSLECLRGNFRIVNTEYLINEQLKAGKKILAEGAQGTLLDVAFGSYPFVTSSNTTVGGVCTGLGVPPSAIGTVYGIVKAYTTRVGGGPFPTELFDGTGKTLQKVGKEVGAVTGRERRCGWIDLVALKYAIMINGVESLILMKSDVLDTFDNIKVCVAYRIDGRKTTEFPSDVEAQHIEPVYETLPGWKADLTNIQSHKKLPKKFKNYVKFLKEQLGIPIVYVSVGPDREQTIPYPIDRKIV